jgi:hypothetical protein
MSGSTVRHLVPLEVRERRLRDLLERVCEAIARCGYGQFSDLDFLAPQVAERVRDLAATYREMGVVVEPEWGEGGQATARLPEERGTPVLAELIVHDRSVLRGRGGAGTALPSCSTWRIAVVADPLCRRIERLEIEALP